MKTARFLIALYSCGLLIQTPSLAQNADPARPAAPSQNASKTPPGRSAEQGQSALIRSAEGQTDQQHAADRPSSDPVSGRGLETGAASENRGARPGAMPERPGRNHAATRGENRLPDRKAQANAKTQRPTPDANRDQPRAASGVRDRAAQAHGEMDQTSKRAPNAPQPGFRQSVNGTRDAVAQNTVQKQPNRPAAPQSPGQSAALVPDPIRNRGTTPAAIGGVAVRASRNTAAISGNAIRHKP